MNFDEAAGRCKLQRIRHKVKHNLQNASFVELHIFQQIGLRLLQRQMQTDVFLSCLVGDDVKRLLNDFNEVAVF